jgi:hypothetical protein
MSDCDYDDDDDDAYDLDRRKLMNKGKTEEELQADVDRCMGEKCSTLCFVLGIAGGVAVGLYRRRGGARAFFPVAVGAAFGSVFDFYTCSQRCQSEFAAYIDYGSN